MTRHKHAAASTKSQPGGTAAPLDTSRSSWTVRPAMEAREEIPAWWLPYAGEFPEWQAWRGISGQYYARQLDTIPPRVVRGRSADELREQIVRAGGSRAS